MSRARALAFLLAYVVPALMPAAAGLGAWSGHVDVAAWFPLAFLFVLLPLADYAIGIGRENPSATEAAVLEASLYFRVITWLCLPVQLVLLAWSAGYFVATPM